MESFWSSLWLTVLNHSDDSYLLPSSELPFFLFTFTITFIFLYFRFSLTSGILVYKGCPLFYTAKPV